MKKHVYRPLFVVVALVVVILGARAYWVPKDFGVHEMGYRFGWHRLGNEQEWKDFKVKYRGKQYCAACHPDKVEMIDATPHTIIECENCHGPAIDHPQDPPKLEINRARAMCLRCHAKLPYENTDRRFIRGINDNEHNPDMECVMCHNPHKPGF